MAAPRRWVGAALLVGLGWLVTPSPVAVYDGIGAPDEPYRCIAAPEGAKPTAPATSAVARSPVSAGRTTAGLTVATAEVGPQFSAFIPNGAFAAPGGTVTVRAVPQAPTDQPRGAVIDGNVYLVTVADSAGPVTITDRNALATLYLRATTAKQPGPVMQHRASPTQPWTPVQTSRAAQDVYVASLTGPGQYALAFPPVAAAAAGGGPPVLPLALTGALVVLVGVVVVVRLRAVRQA